MKNPKTSAQRRGIPLSEWIAAGIGAALVLASIAILIHSVATSPGTPPRLKVRVISVEPAGEQQLVMIEVGNEGGSTAADARIEAELRERGALVERNETTIDFVPPNSTRRAGLYFSRDPRAHELTLRASGYKEP
jgi:uncharacterized protein (TIGR02588 family)